MAFGFFDNEKLGIDFGFCWKKAFYAYLATIPILVVFLNGFLKIYFQIKSCSSFIWLYNKSTNTKRRF